MLSKHLCHFNISTIQFVVWHIDDTHTHTHSLTIKTHIKSIPVNDIWYTNTYNNLSIMALYSIAIRKSQKTKPKYVTKILSSARQPQTHTGGCKKRELKKKTTIFVCLCTLVLLSCVCVCTLFWFLYVTSLTLQRWQPFLVQIYRWICLYYW